MVEREKLSLWSSDGVRNLLVRTEERKKGKACKRKDHGKF